jgi:hypothetical protein
MKYETPRDRILIYKQLIHLIDDDICFSMCPTLNGILDRSSSHLRTNDMTLDLLPELKAQTPEHITTLMISFAARTSNAQCHLAHPASYVWFPLSREGMESRKQCLLKAIELCKTYAKLKYNEVFR